jgi:hypothetical protein
MTSLQATATAGCTPNTRPAPKKPQDALGLAMRRTLSGSWEVSFVDEHTDQVMDLSSESRAMVVTPNDLPARRVTRTSSPTGADNLDHYYAHLPLAGSGMRVAIDDRDEGWGMRSIASAM